MQEGENSLMSVSKAALQNPEQSTKAAATAMVFAATARFPQLGKGGSESFCSPGERVETNKKGRGRIKVILNH